MLLFFLLLCITSPRLYSASAVEQDFVIQPDLLDSVLGKHYKTLLSGQVKEFKDLVYQTLQEDKGFYKFEYLWDKWSLHFHEYCANNQEVYSQRVRVGKMSMYACCVRVRY